MGALLLRQVPEHLLARVSSGELKVYGSIIRSLTSGRIVAHLQETSALAHAAGSLLSAPASLPLQGANLAIDAVGHSVSYAQNEQIKSAVSMLQSMQVLDLALGVAAIGVSVAGFAILSKKLARTEAKVEALHSRLDELARGIELIRRERLTEDFVRLRTAIEQLDEAWVLTDGATQWRQVANEAHFLANQFARRAGELLDAAPADLPAIDPFLEALALSANIRITARMAADDDAAARLAARDGAAALSVIGERLRLGEAALSTIGGQVPGGTTAWSDRLAIVSDEYRPLVDCARAREAAAAATCLTIEELGKQGISTRVWLETAREEHESPLLCVAAD